jgi:hypothetical protein
MRLFAANPILLRLTALLLCACALAACGDRDGKAARNADGTQAEALPTPEGTRGSVTGMPDAPGPGQVAMDEEIPPEDELAVDESNPEAGLGEDGDDPDATPGEPSAGDAVEVVSQYYAALQEHDFGSAYALWGDGGRASGQTPDQFAAGFATTADIVATVDAPVRMEGAVGSRYVEVPVAVEATGADGRVRRYVGAYVLRRSVVDGATEEQRAWRIASADLRELAE